MIALVMLTAVACAHAAAPAARVTDSQAPRAVMPMALWS